MDVVDVLAGWQKLGKTKWAMYAPPNASVDEQTSHRIRVLLKTLRALSKNSPGVGCSEDAEVEFARDLYGITVSDFP